MPKKIANGLLSAPHALSLRHLAVAMGLLIPLAANSQIKVAIDTLECHIIGFSFGSLFPGNGSASGGTTGANIRDLYKGPFLDFDLDCYYKYQSNWMVSLEADLWFGYNSDNLRDRTTRIGDVYTPGGYALSWGGYDGAVTAYNRGLSVRGGMAKILPFSSRNPNSGLLLKASAGWMMQRTIFSQDMNESPVPQLQGDYAHLYDHLRHGAILTEGIGLAYMSNYLTYVNLKLTFEVSQCLTFPQRPWQIDNLAGINGKDTNRYFDLIYSLKLTWWFPLMGKTTYDYYYY